MHAYAVLFMNIGMANDTNSVLIGKTVVVQHTFCNECFKLLNMKWKKETQIHLFQASAVPKEEIHWHSAEVNPAAKVSCHFARNPLL